MPDGLYNLWKALKDDLHASQSIRGNQPSKHSISCALFWAHEGRYGNTVHSFDIADKSDNVAFEEHLLQNFALML